MALRIKILPEQLTNRIAAGEVVERPASVVKELVENAIDSGCTEVVIETETGGKRLIRVTDNGCGMSREDGLLALERHATSKISTDEDLFGLTTLGFRGEALPSIASVSRFTLSTREADRIEGTEIYAEGGRIRDVKACGMAPGTVVTVRNLFFNLPARLKFMKSTETESGHVGDLLTKLALSRPDIRFTYLNDGKTVFRVGAGDLASRVSALLGKGIMGTLFPLETDSASPSVTGFIAGPDCSRSSTASMYTYINGRYIRDRVVQHAILQGYRNSLERGRYPVVVLFIDIAPGEVDVNVHPTKHEVRFREQARVHDAITAAVEKLLRRTPWKRTETPLITTAAPQTTMSAAVRVVEVRESLSSYQASLSRSEAPTVAKLAPSPWPSASLPPEFPATPLPQIRGYFSSLSLIGQYNASYIVCQDGGDLVLVDQHAAHERVAFERLKRQCEAGGVESQGLLFPHTLELTLREGAILREHGDHLKQLGFEVENFGGSTWAVKSIPQMLSGDVERYVRDILDELGSLGRTRTFSDARDDILATLACHSVVRGMHTLSGEEIKALFAQMDETDFSGNCPHGRPVFRKLTLGEIERMFKRT